jgi:hypothetical protein
VLAGNPGTLPLTARFKKFFGQRTLAESTQSSINVKMIWCQNMGLFQTKYTRFYAKLRSIYSPFSAKRL